jgi:type 2 lantibiotic biosynthesis protein LanM
MAVDMADPRWFLAYSLSERLPAGGSPGDTDNARGRRRLDRWREEPAFIAKPELFDAYLAAHDVDADVLVELLGETDEAVRSRFRGAPEYVRTIERAWRDRQPPAIDADGADDHHDHHHPHAGFTDLVQPLVDDGARRIRTAVHDLCAQSPSPYIDPKLLADQLCVPPAAPLQLLVGRVLVLELNVLRIEQRLAGDTPEQRFQDFTRRLRDPEYALGVLTEYPVLARDATRIVDNWVEARVEFATRLVADVAAVAARLAEAGPPGVVTDVSLGAGDSHRGGRSVGIVRFGNGTRAVYKPRSLRVDIHFRRLLEWVNQRGADPAFRTLWVLDRGEYGWTEFVAARPCHDMDALRRFYTRQGGYLALLHCLAAVDFHYENIIAAGEHPVLVDLEALFHPEDDEVPGDLTVPAHALRALRDSVLSVGILPRPILYRDDDEVGGVDFSGLAGAAGQHTPTPVATWEDIGTDQMRLVRRRLEIGGGQNLPRLDAGDHHALDFGDDIVAGFQATYRLIRRHREALLAADGPLAAFAGDEVRVILRATRSYAQVLQESRHPDLLRDALDRDRFFTYLWLQQQWSGHGVPIAAAEQAQMSRGDIPIFTTRPSSRDLVTGDGTVVAGVLGTTGLDRARERIAALSETHLAQQTWFLRGSLAALAIGEGQGRWSGYKVPLAGAPAPTERFVAAARAAGDRLMLTASTGENTISWLGLTFVADNYWQIGPTGIDLYSGLSGIALYLGYLGDVTGERRYRRAAEVAAHVLVEQIGRLDDTPDETLDRLTVGAFNELGGPVYALSHLGVLWHREDLLDAAVAMVPALRRMAPGDQALDIISGSAGAVLALLSLYAARPAPEVLDAARTFAATLVRRAEQARDGIGWRGAMNPNAALAGFSHGASGIAVALARLDQVLGRRDHAGLVRGALRFERSLYDPANRCWLDLRETTPDEYTMIAWCHGGPGIGMARTDLLGYLGDDEILDEDLDNAVAGILEYGFGGDVITGTGNHSICHGDLGNLETLLLAARARGDDELAHRTALVGSSILTSVEQEGWLCGVPLGAETPGLMSGIAGIGYNLLRLAMPERIPSVLLLEGPRQR